jgi:hypothetical protein
MARNIIFIAIAAAFYWVLKSLYGKRDGTVSDMPNKSYSWLAMALALGLILGTPYWGTKIPGSFFERNDYRGMFYVNLFPDGQTVKSHRVPALIEVSLENDTYYDDRLYSWHEYKIDYSWREYKIDYAIIPNIGEISFYNADKCLELNKIAILCADNGQYWGVELTDRPVKK